MTNELLLFIFFLLVIVAAGDIIRRAFLTLQRERRQKEIQGAMRKVRRPLQPQVTVLVYAKDSTDAVETTLRSLQKNRYGAFDVVVVNERENTQQYKAPNRLDAAFLRRRVAGSKMDAYRAAYRKSRRGSIVVCLDAGVRVDPQFTKRAAATSSSTGKWRVEYEGVYDGEGIRGVAAALSRVLWNRRSFVWAYTPSALRRERKDRTTVWVAWLLWWEVTLILVILASFIIGPVLLWYVWLVFSGYLLGLIWLKGGWSASQKLTHSFAVPSALFLLPVTSFIEASFQLGARK